MKSPFVVGITELRRDRAAPLPVEISIEIEWRLELSRVLGDPPFEASLRVSSMPGSLLVDGTARAVVRYVCHRCLDEWDEVVEVAVMQLVVDDPEDEDADYVLDGPELDLEPILRDELLLALPLSPVCRPNCKGVVDTAETDLNTGIPGDEGDSASPFAVLRDLLDVGD